MWDYGEQLTLSYRSSNMWVARVFKKKRLKSSSEAIVRDMRIYTYIDTATNEPKSSYWNWCVLLFVEQW